MSETKANQPDEPVPIPRTSNAFLEDGIRLVNDMVDRDKEDQACPICFRPYVQQKSGESKVRFGSHLSVPESRQSQSHEQPVQILACGHIFGKECLTLHVKCWEVHANKCPMCRTMLFSRPEGSVGLLHEAVAEANEEMSTMRRLTQRMRRIIGRNVTTNPTLTQDLLPDIEQREILLSRMAAQYAEVSEAARQLMAVLENGNLNRTER